MFTMLFGAISGLLTSVLPEAIGYFKRAQDHQFELESMRVQAELAERQAALWVREAELAADTAANAGVYQFASSQRTDTWVDRLNASVRPVVTYAFVGLFLSVVASIIVQNLALGVSITNALIVVSPMIEGPTSAILTFWFGNRTLEKMRR